MVWVAVALLCVGNVYIGSLIATWGLPRSTLGSRSAPAAAFCLASWAAGWLVLYRFGHLTLTFTQACILGACGYLSYQHNWKGWGRGKPPVPWDEKLNAIVRAASRICERHGWRLLNAEEADSLAARNRLHFTGADYDLLMQIQGDVEYELNRMMDRSLPRMPDGQIDYDRASAQRIISLAGMLSGTDERIGMVDRVMIDHDLSGFDREAFEQMKWLAEAVRRQWGIERLWARADAGQKQ